MQFTLKASGKSIFVRESIRRQAKDIEANGFPDEAKQSLWLVANALDQYALKQAFDTEMSVEATVEASYKP